MRFDIDHIVALAYDGSREEESLHLLCGYCNRVKGSKCKDGNRLRLGELRTDNMATGVMVEQGLAVLTASNWPVTTG